MSALAGFAGLESWRRKGGKNAVQHPGLKKPRAKFGYFPVRLVIG